MIKHTEIRVGNIVKLNYKDYHDLEEDGFLNDKNNIWFINSIKSDGKLEIYNKIENLFEYVNEEQIEGLEISEEILLKCGFDKDEDGWLHISYNQEDHTESYGIKWNGEYWEYYMFDLTKINYLHQLQNLIFSLTGQELNTSGL